MKIIEIVIDNVRKLRRLIAAGFTKEAEESVYKIAKYMFDGQTIGLDLDGTIDENPEFFRMLSHLWPGNIIIVTCRSDKEKAKRDVDKFDIFYNAIVTVNRLEDKAKVIKEYGIDIYIDDQDECLIDIPMDVTVLKIRNGGNFVDKKWIYSNRTGKEI